MINLMQLLQELEKARLFIRPQQITVHIENEQIFYVHMIPLIEVFSKLFQKQS